tara:strand:+ start:117 stop:278 length:162 start_codon:yes stop_codon:yes gene_type:complete
METGVLKKVLARIEECLKDDSLDLKQLEVLGLLYTQIQQGAMMNSAAPAQRAR